jgi:ABC-type uncharacterized transport system auxiliary subunit
MRTAFGRASVVRLGVASVAAMLVALASLSCGRGASSSMYTLRVPQPPAAAGGPLPIALGVEQFHAVDPLNDRRILRYESSTELKYYEDDYWVSDPATLMSELTARYLARMHIVKQVVMVPWSQTIDYTIGGRVLDFEEIDSNRGRQARVALELTVANSPDHEVVWSGTFRAEEPVSGGGVRGLVEAMSAAADKVLREASEEISAHLPH